LTGWISLALYNLYFFTSNISDISEAITALESWNLKASEMILNLSLCIESTVTVIDAPVYLEMFADNLATIYKVEAT